MKQLLIFTILFLVTGCGKESPPVNYESILTTGSWASDGGNGTAGTILIFNADGICREYAKVVDAAHEISYPYKVEGERVFFYEKVNSAPTEKTGELTITDKALRAGEYDIFIHK